MTPDNRGSIQVLHVDDDRAFTELTARSVERVDERFTVVTETEVDAGLDRLAEERVDCIVSDYQMADTDGLAFLAVVREDNPDLPFILFTGRGSEAVASEAISEGVTDYLQKETGGDQFTVLANRIRNAVTGVRIERRLTESERRYRRLVDTAPVPIIILTDPEIVYANTAAARFFDAERGEDLVGRSSLDHVPPADRGAIRERITATLAGGTAWGTDEQRFQTFGGDDRVALTAGSSVTIDGEQAIQLVLQDITDLKERERDLGLFRSLLDSSNDALYVIDPETGHLLDVNDTACRRLGYDRGELLDRSVMDISADVPDGDAWAAHVARLREMEEDTFEAEHLRKDGTTVPVGVGVVHAEVDGAAYMLAISRDMTGRRRREGDIERQNERLEAFAEAVAHELRNPLNAADGYLSMARENRDSELLGQVADSHDNLGARLDGVLAFARQAKAVTNPEPVPLLDVIEAAWEQVGPPDASLSVEEDLGLVTCEKGRVCQLLENVLKNAVDHAGPEVSVTVGSLRDRKGFYVEDDGPGIPTDDWTAVFDRAYSPDSDVTGFGLTIAAEIAAAHGWELAMAQARGGGARFEIHQWARE